MAGDLMGGCDVTLHWCERVKERIGPDVDPVVLARAIKLAVEQMRDDLVEYAGRENKNGMRWFRFRATNGRKYLALTDTNTGAPVTVLYDEWRQ